jgi:hypothetical protein
MIGRTELRRRTAIMSILDGGASKWSNFIRNIRPITNHIVGRQKLRGNARSAAVSVYVNDSN